MEQIKPWVAAFALSVALGSFQCAGAAIEVTHNPKQPKSGESMRISITSTTAPPEQKWAVEYQMVEPGKYIARNDASYAQNWSTISLVPTPNRSGEWTAEIPASVQKHRRLIRYRVVDAQTNKQLEPKPEDSCPNFAYFVYDGIPAWRAAVNPSGTGPEAEASVFSAEVMRSVQAYHLLSSRAMVENAMWKDQTDFGSEEAHEYRWLGTLVGADGTVYDHIRFRPRGGCWRYAMGKNMWKFDFNKGHKFRAQDNWRQPYRAGWSKLNLGACIQQGDYGMRGEQGLFESVGFRLFNLAGVAAPETHFVQLRVVTTADEQGKNQYTGDFWGLYLAVENVDDNFVRQHELPSQSVFKVDGMRPHWGKQGADQLTEADAGRFVQEMFRRPGEAWWRENVQLLDYYAYRSVLECIHHYDVDGGKNYFFRRDPINRHWSVVPWDIDLTWGDHMFGGGGEPFLAAGALRYPRIHQEYQNRLRAIRDLLFNPEQTGALIEEYAALIATSQGGLTFAEADRRLWDYHPILSSRYVMGGFKTQPGLFYQKSPGRSIAGMVKLMKSYVESRGRFVDARLLAGQTIPPRPIVVRDETTDGQFRFRLAEAVNNTTRVEWRLADFYQPGVADRARGSRGVYEITEQWSTNAGTHVTIPLQTLQPKRTYRLRARFVDQEGDAGHYSKLVELKTP